MTGFLASLPVSDFSSRKGDINCNGLLHCGEEDESKEESSDLLLYHLRVHPINIQIYFHAPSSRGHLRVPPHQSFVLKFL